MWQIGIKDVQLNVQQLCGAHMVTKISEETFQHEGANPDCT